MDLAHVKWFDKKIKWNKKDWIDPNCSRCRESLPIHKEAFMYGELWFLCKGCCFALNIIPIEQPKLTGVAK